MLSIQFLHALRPFDSQVNVYGLLEVTTTLAQLLKLFWLTNLAKECCHTPSPSLKFIIWLMHLHFIRYNLNVVNFCEIHGAGGLESWCYPGVMYGILRKSKKVL